MSNQSYEVNPADRAKKGREPTVSNRTPTLTNLPAVAVPTAGSPRGTTSTHQCPTCGAWAPSGTSVCTECGARLHTKPQKIRCRLCGAHASTSLVLCPGCGRELHPAPSRVLSWGAPAILVLLFLIVLVQRWENGNPLRWTQTQWATGRNWVTQIAQQLDPQITIATLPASSAESGANVGLSVAPSALQLNTLPENGAPDNLTDNLTDNLIVPAPSETQGGITNAANLEAELPASNPATNPVANPVVETTLVTPTVTVSVPTATALPTPQPTATAMPPAPTATALVPTATATTQPTPTNAAVTATATARQPAASAVVQSLPTANADEDITAAGVLSKTETSTLTILQPTPTTVPTETATPTPAPPTPAPVTYTIRAGDTPLEIANQFGISVDALFAANGLSVSDARRLRVGQVLVISAGDTALPSPTETPTATVTPATTTTAPPTNTPSPTNTPPSTMRVDAPALRSPEVGASLSCRANNDLVWLPVAYIRDNDQYLLHLGFLSGYNSDGSEQVTWILEQWRPANVTLWDLDEGLCGLAPQAFGRQWRWYVEVVETTGSSWRPVSLPSAIWGFSWN